VTLVDGRSIPYDYLVIATGAAQPPPTILRAVSREQAISELQRFQKHIFSAEKIAVIGGGAAGIELVTEIKEAYRDKQVTLIHSRSQLLPRFGPKLHEYVTKELNTLGVEMLLGERPQMQIPGNEESHPRPIILRMANGSERKFDLVVRFILCSK
jgi:NADH dehydrogenase FAD-containing subunit